ncbi:hypothetical protein [uncultured Tolumonas sp.]|uniref:hypothetical protein n=1 Tax=uncultured Tolumonas sp. TaxID=263765 RepID=UPI002A0A3CF8|nr:hypothetical protein [uncultured Tolumonas sp.]
MQSLILINSLIDVCITEVYQTACSLYVQSSHDFFSEFRKFKISTKLGDKLGFFEPAHSLPKPHDGKKILVIIGYDPDDAFFELMKYQDVDLSHYHVFISPAPTSFAMSHVKNVIEYNVYCSLLDYLNNNETADIGITVGDVITEVFNNELSLSLDLPEYKSDFNYNDYVMFQYPYCAFLADKFESNKKIGIKIPFLTEVKYPFYLVIDIKSDDLIKLIGNEEHIHQPLFENFIQSFNQAINHGLPLHISLEDQRLLELLNNAIGKDILHDELECDANVVDKCIRRKCCNTLTNTRTHLSKKLNDSVFIPLRQAVRSAENKSFFELYFNEMHKFIVKSNNQKPTVKLISNNVVNILELTVINKGCWEINLNAVNPLVYKINMKEGVIDLNYLLND